VTSVPVERRRTDPAVRRAIAQKVEVYLFLRENNCSLTGVIGPLARVVQTFGLLLESQFVPLQFLEAVTAGNLAMR